MDEGLLCCVPFIVDADSVKLTLREAFFFKPLRPRWLGNTAWLVKVY